MIIKNHTKKYNIVKNNNKYTKYSAKCCTTNKIITYRKVDKTLIDMYNSGEHLSTLILEGDTYLIFHEKQEYYVYPKNTLDEELLTDNLKDITEFFC